MKAAQNASKKIEVQIIAKRKNNDEIKKSLISCEIEIRMFSLIFLFGCCDNIEVKRVAKNFFPLSNELQAKEQAKSVQQSKNVNEQKVWNSKTLK